MKKFLTNLGRDTQGNALMLLAAGLIPITMMIGSGVDASIAYTTRAQLQNACDAGALAGRLAMIGDQWTDDTEDEARKFFDFNFPVGTNGVDDVSFAIDQDPDDPAQVIGSATGSVPTTLMFIFGFDSMDLSVDCDAKRDMGHNDVLLVLDVTSSMLDPPTVGGDAKIDRLRTGVMGLYRALDDGNPQSETRFAFVPYSQTVNVARQLGNGDIIKPQWFVDLNQQLCTGNGKNATCTTIPVASKEIGANESYWNNGQNGNSNANAQIQGFRTSGFGCIEERPSYGEEYNDGEFVLHDTVTIEDVNEKPGTGNDLDLKFGRYEPPNQEGYKWDACISEAKQFAEYDSEKDFETAVGEVTARVSGATYSDLGMLWGARFASRDGIFSSNNPKKKNDVPVNVHIIFFTDGMIYGSRNHYSSYGVERYQGRLTGDGTYKEINPSEQAVTAKLKARFSSVCTLAKSMGMTIWVVALDTTYDPVNEACATSSAHFFESDGDDLEDKFTEIGQGIGNLRLTR